MQSGRISEVGIELTGHLHVNRAALNGHLSIPSTHASAHPYCLRRRRRRIKAPPDVIGLKKARATMGVNYSAPDDVEGEWYPMRILLRI